MKEVAAKRHDDIRLFSPQAIPFVGAFILSPVLVLQIKSFDSYFQFKVPRLNDPKFARISLYERILDRSTPGTFNLKIALKTFDLEY